MERDTSVGTNALFTRTECPEILGRLRNDVVVKLHHYSPFQLSSYAYVKTASWPPHISLSPSKSFLSLQIREKEEKDKQWKTLSPAFYFQRLIIQTPSLHLRLLLFHLTCAAYDVWSFSLRYPRFVYYFDFGHYFLIFYDL